MDLKLLSHVSKAFEAKAKKNSTVNEEEGELSSGLSSDGDIDMLVE
jgi:hypothetical protein